MTCIILTIFCFSLSLLTIAQDDYPDYRNKRDNFIKIPSQQKDIRYDLATFSMAGLDESVGKQPLQTIPAVNAESNYMKFEGNGIQVIVRSGVFEPSKHKLQYYDENKYLVKIDGKPYYGNYGQKPVTTISEVTVIIGKDTVHVPQTALFDLYNPTFTYRDQSGTIKTHNGVYLSADKHRIYVYMLNREPKSSYEVTWVIQDKQYLRRVVDFGLLQ